MHTNERFNLICKLINEEIDDTVADEYDPAIHDDEESYRNETIADYCAFLRKELQSDNA